MKRCFYGWLVAAVLLAVPWMGSVDAAPIPLSDLLVDGATLESGDKIFSNFTYRKAGDMPAPANVIVEAIEEAGEFGLMFTGAFVDAAGGDASDALVTFDVSVKNPAMLINGVTLKANPAVINGKGMATVTETFLNVITDDKLVVYDFGDGDDLLLNSITFDQGYTTLPVQKDLVLYAQDETGAVTMSFFTQTFSQVPEPSSLLLAATGLLCLGGIRRRRG